MPTNLLCVVLALFVGVQTPAAAQVAAPKTTATTPTGCVREISAFGDAKYAELGIPSGPITDRTKALQAQQVAQAKAAMARNCAAQFDAKTAGTEDLPSLIDLYSQADMMIEAKVATDRALPIKTMAPAERATLLVTALRVVRRATPNTGGWEARVAQYPQLERISEELDANIAATFDQRFGVHYTMLAYYRGDDIDAGIIKHGTWMLNAAKSFTSEQHTKYGSPLTNAHLDVAEAWADEGMTDKALELLRQGAQSLADHKGADSFFGPAIARYMLVGKEATPISAPQWLNAPADIRAFTFSGAVTLVEFTAHWCGPCRESYPAINRLRAQFGKSGFNVVMVTRFWGYFSSPEKGMERNISADDELARDRAYFAEHQLDVPVAIGAQVDERIVDGNVVEGPPDPNEAAYHVTGIPQIQVIDKAGVIRRILIGYDKANEPRLADLVKQLLAEK